MVKPTKAVSWLFEYDRTKAPPEEEWDFEMRQFYGMMADAAAEDPKNIDQINPKKARIEVSKEIQDKWKLLKDEDDQGEDDQGEDDDEQ